MTCYCFSLFASNTLIFKLIIFKQIVSITLRPINIFSSFLISSHSSCFISFLLASSYLLFSSKKISSLTSFHVTSLLKKHGVKPNVFYWSFWNMALDTSIFSISLHNFHSNWASWKSRKFTYEICVNRVTRTNKPNAPSLSFNPSNEATKSVGPTICL